MCLGLSGWKIRANKTKSGNNRVGARGRKTTSQTNIEITTPKSRALCDTTDTV